VNRSVSGTKPFHLALGVAEIGTAILGACVKRESDAMLGEDVGLFSTRQTATRNIPKGICRFVRYLGNQVLRVMGEDQTNRWVMDQVMTIEPPDVTDKLRTSMQNLFK